MASDDNYYHTAILPIPRDFLPADETQYTSDTPTVTDFPGYYNPNASGDDFKAYFQAITDELNAASPDSFNPALSTPDALIQSINVTP